MSTQHDPKQIALPVHVTQMLQKVLDDGQITDQIQYVYIASVLQHLHKKDQIPLTQGRDHRRDFAANPQSDELEAVKTLTATEAVDMVEWIFQTLTLGSHEESEHEQLLKWTRFL